MPTIVSHQAFVQGVAAASGSITPAATPVAGNWYIVLIDQLATSAAETLSDSAGNTWTSLANAATSSSDCISIWQAPLVTIGGGYTINYSGISTGGRAGFEIVQVGGTSLALDGTPACSNFGNSNAVAINLSLGTAASANDLALFMIVPNASKTITWTPPLIVLDIPAAQPSNPMYAGSGIVPGPGPYTAQATMNSSVVKAAGGVMISSAGVSVGVSPSLLFVMP